MSDPFLAALDSQLAEVKARREAIKVDQDATIAKAATEERSTLSAEETDAFIKNTNERNELAAREASIIEQRAARVEEIRRDGIAVTDMPKVTESRAKIVAEERTYTPQKDQRGAGDGGASFIHDVYAYQYRADLGARARLERHATELERDGLLSPREQRAVATSGFAGLVVPQYLVQLAALAARNGRPFANAVTRLTLPDQGMALVIPRGTTGASEATPTGPSENANVSSTDEVWANLTVNVTTIAGQQDVSRQSVERGIPGLDALIYRDLAGAYAAELDRQLIAGVTGSSQAQGIQFAGGTQATAFGAAATASTFYTKIAGAINAIESSGTVVAPANLILMHPRRFSWLLGQVDTAGRPLVTPVTNGVQNFNSLGVDVAPGAYSGNPQAATTGVDVNGFTVKGYLQGLPVITDANVPTSVGSGPEDLVFVVNTDHLLLWENGDGMPTQLRFEQTLGNQLTVKLIAYNYFAFTAARYPTAVSIIGGNATVGNGLVAPTF